MAAPNALYAPGRPPRTFFLALLAEAYALLRAAARARASGSAAMLLRALSLELCIRPAALHFVEQYRAERFGVVNFVPHSLQSRVIFLPISLSALAAHRLQ